nr:retrovirus-related Pol polyprotein from transposon TNT 1-94 [Tanacetum cinerariifolium]
NGVAERRNKTLIEATRTMLADAKLPVTFWDEAVNTACYVQNRVLVNKSHNKTPYELFNGRSPAIGFLKPFGCHVMILNTLDHLGKFEAKGDEGYFIRYSMYSKALRVHAALLESSSSKPQDDCSTNVPESSGNFNPIATSTNPSADHIETLTGETSIPTNSSQVPTACFTDSQEPSSDTRLISKRVANQVETPSLDNILTLTNKFEDIFRVTTNSDELNGVEADVSNIETTITASPTPTLRIHKDHPKSQIIGPVDTLIQTRNKSKEVGEQSFIATIHQKTDPALLQFCLFSYFLSQVELKKIFDALQDPRWMDVKSAFLYGTIDEEVYVMQPPGFQVPEFPARVYKVEKEMYGLHQAPRAWYGTLSKYLLTNGFQSGTIDQTLFIRRQRGDFILVQVYVDDIIFGSSNLQLCREFEALMHEKFQMSAMGELNFFLDLQVLQKEDGIFLSQYKYVGDILKKFGYSDVRSANTPMDKENP